MLSSRSSWRKTTFTEPEEHTDLSRCLVLAILLLVTCSTQLFLPIDNNQCEKPHFGPRQLPMHQSFPSAARSFSDSQTLRPSHDTQYDNFKYPGLTYQRGPFRPFIPPLDFEKASPNHPAFNPKLQNPFDASQTNLLPSPLAPLPLRPDRTTSMRSHPPLSRSQTTDTISSSVYSRSISTESLLSGQPSPLNLTGDNPFNRVPSPLAAKSVSKTPTVRQVNDDTTPDPTRPISKPAMPPVAFWLYAHTQQQDHFPTHESNTPSINPFNTHILHSSTPTSPHHLRKASLSRTNTLHAHAYCDTNTSSRNFSHPLPIRTPSPSPSPIAISISNPIPIPPTPAIGEEEEGSASSKALRLKHQGSYERLRKGAWAGKQDLDRRLGALAVLDGRGGVGGQNGVGGLSGVGKKDKREKKERKSKGKKGKGKGKEREVESEEEEEREMRKVVRIRRPSGAF